MSVTELSTQGQGNQGPISAEIVEIVPTEQDKE